tara:strand:- start:2555 stop:2773 length:219 start_codon:yes stop_codon:yes gene_type:complete
MKEKDNNVPYEIFKDILKKSHKSQADVDYLKVALEYVLEKDSDMYNEALEYADKLKANNYFTDDEIKKWQKK